MMGFVGILLHIGVPKTGTTAVQTALNELDQIGEGLAGYGVAMPGTPLEQARAALSVLEQSVNWSQEGRPTSPNHWPRMAARLQAAQTGARTALLSSEYLCEAPPATIERISRELGPDVRVVITLRPLSRILPSAWQQYLKSGHQLRYPSWLKAVLATPPKATVTPSFWRRHDQGAVIERWAEGFGADRLTVVVLDPDDRQLLFGAFEDLLGLPEGVLKPGPTARQNRSMTAAEAELFRRLNAVLRRQELPWPDYAHLVRYGAILRTVEQLTPAQDAPLMATPPWALDRAEALGREYAERIGALQARGLTVVGDLKHLAERPADPVEAAGPTDQVPVEVAVQALLGAMSRSIHGTAFFADEMTRRPENEAASMPGQGRKIDVDSMPVYRATTRQLGVVVVDRVRDSLKRRRRATAASSARVVRSGLAMMRTTPGRRRSE